MLARIAFPIYALCAVALALVVPLKEFALPLLFAALPLYWWSAETQPLPERTAGRVMSFLTILVAIAITLMAPGSENVAVLVWSSVGLGLTVVYSLSAELERVESSLVTTKGRARARGMRGGLIAASCAYPVMLFLSPGWLGATVATFIVVGVFVRLAGEVLGTMGPERA